MELVVDLYLHIMTRRSKRTNAFTTKFHNTTLRYSTDSQHWLWKGGETKFYQVLLLMVRRGAAH